VEVAKAVWRGDYTYLEDPLVNGNPEAVVSVTQNWNLGGRASTTTTPGELSAP
jgi:hypothetical protein